MATVLITGAAGGLGQSLQQAFRGEGYEVVATDVEGAPHVLDVTDPDACRAMARCHRPDVWINNAALLGAGEAASQSDSELERVVSVNLLGCINGTRAALDVMRKRGSGHIINIGSLASWVPVPGEAVYAATKAGILSYSLGLLAELKREGESGVAISVVCPDGMFTPMLSRALDNPHIALSFSAPHLVDTDTVSARVVGLVRRPRRVVSVPRWRGAMVRAMSAAPDHLLGLSNIFGALGRRNQEKLRSASSEPATQRHGPG